MADPVAPDAAVDEGGVPHPIVGGPTDLTGFVGVTARGPTAPTLVTSWDEFQTVFGGFVDQPPYITPYWRLAYAVRGFFENGGSRAVIARVLDALAPAADGDLAAVIGDHADPTAVTGLTAMMAVPELTLVAVPDDVAVPALGDALLVRCEARRDRFALLNAPAHTRDLDVIGQHRDSAFGALYYPCLHVPAPHRPEGYAVAPPCGHVAGLYADAAVAAGVRQTATELAPSSLLADDHASGAGPLSQPITAATADRLVQAGVNPLRNFRHATRGVRVWSARTMSSDPEWRYVHIRRLFIYLEQSIGRGTQWVVFEPNSEPTWTGVRAAITGFLIACWRDGAFAGATPRDAFFVRCDRSTMTQDDIDNGRLICLVGVAPLRPAEFVIFRIGQWTADRP